MIQCANGKELKLFCCGISYMYFFILNLLHKKVENLFNYTVLIKCKSLAPWKQNQIFVSKFSADLDILSPMLAKMFRVSKFLQ